MHIYDFIYPHACWLYLKYKIVGSHPYHMAGVLCGSCRNGYGVSVLLNECVTCPDASGMLIAVLSEYQLCVAVECM